MKDKILFSNIILDRREKNRSIIDRQIDLQKKNTRHIFYLKNNFLFDLNDKKPKLKVFHNLNPIKKFLLKDFFKKSIFLGYINNESFFCHDLTNTNFENELNDEQKIFFPNFKESYVFCDVKNVLGVLNKKDANLISISKSIIEWNNKNNFCSKCGYKISSIDMGWSLTCSKCKFRIFPRIDPVVIMLIKNKEYILLARSKAWPEGMYSCPAGFMEPGETIEDAVRRETMEEVGIKLKKIKYMYSQPWPFPYSLMIGCSGQTKSFKIKTDYEELEDAKWFSKKEVKKALQKKSNWFPARKGAIARNLITQWLKE